jgi:hypothetical protein
MALAEISSYFLQPYVYITLADPAMPISPTYVAAGYPFCKPLINPMRHYHLVATGVETVEER